MDIESLIALLALFGCVYFWGDITSATRKIRWRLRMWMKPKNFIGMLVIVPHVVILSFRGQVLFLCTTTTSSTEGWIGDIWAYNRCAQLCHYICLLSVGIDYTESNKNYGQCTFQGKCLHTLDPKILNPYPSFIAVSILWWYQIIPLQLQSMACCG